MPVNEAWSGKNEHVNSELGVFQKDPYAVNKDAFMEMSNRSTSLSGGVRHGSLDQLNPDTDLTYDYFNQVIVLTATTK